MTDRSDLITGLRALADFLESHPDLPVPFSVSASPHISGDAAEGHAEVDQIAGILGVTSGFYGSGRTHYTAERQFGGGVDYHATSIATAYMGAYQQHMEEFRKEQAASDD